MKNRSIKIRQKLLKFLDQDFDSLSSENINIEKMKFGGLVNSLSTQKARGIGITREVYRQKVQVPSPIFP